MKKTYPLRASLLILVLAFAASPLVFALSPIYDPLSNGRAALAQQTPAALEAAHQAFKTGLQTTPNDAALNFFYAATLLAREAHTDSFKQQFINLNATILNPSIYSLEYSFPLGFGGILLPPPNVGTDAHLAYLNSKAAHLDEALSYLDKITDGNFTLTLTSAETSLLDTQVDFADVCLLRAGLRLARASLHLANSYNLSGEYRKLYDLYAAGNLTPQAVLTAFPQFFNLSSTPTQRTNARTQIQLAHGEWNKALEAIKATRQVATGGSGTPPRPTPPPAPFALSAFVDTTHLPYFFEFDSVAASEEVDALFDTLVASLGSQVTFPVIANEDFALEGYTINLSSLVTSPSGPRSLAPTRFDRGFFRPSTWPDSTLGGVFPGATQDDANDAGNFLFVLQPTVYEPYQFWLLAGTPDEPGYFEEGEVRFNKINGIAVDANGNIYVADEGNHVIRKISIDNKVTTIAGQKWSGGNEREALVEKYSAQPARYPGILDWNVGPITVDANGTVYFVNGYRISKISVAGVLSDLAGSDQWRRDPADGIGAAASFDYIQAITVDAQGNVYVCDVNAIRKITPAGLVTTLAGKLRVGDDWDTDGYGYVDGPGNQARFRYPDGIDLDPEGNLFVTDRYNNVIRKVQPDGTTSSFVGNAKISNHLDAKGIKSRLNQPHGLAIDSSGNLYFADGSTIRKVKPDGTVTTLAGKLSPETTLAGKHSLERGAFRLRGQMGIQEAAGEAAVFGEEDITGLAVDRRGTLYASFGASIYEAESIAAPPSGTPFPTPTPLPSPVPQPSPAPSPIPVASQLFSLTLATTTVDVTNGMVNLSFAANATSSLRQLNLSFTNNGSHGMSLYAYAYRANTSQPFLSGLISVPGFSNPGLWTLSSLNLYDESYQGTSLSGNELEKFYENLGIAPLAFTVTNSNPDTTPPTLHKLEFLDTEANTSNSSAKIRYRFEVSDDLSGFSHLSLNLHPVSGWSWSHHSYSPSISMDGNRTTYEGIIEIPQGSQVGDWVIDSISWQDKAGNSLNYASWNNSMPADLAALKITIGPNFTNSTALEDKYHPWVVGFEIEPEAVDVSSADQKVTIRVRVNNDNLPTPTSISAELRKLNQDNNWRDDLEIRDFRLASGTVANGVYEAELVVPKNYKTGNYTLDSLYVSESGNYNGTWTSTKSWSRYSSNMPAEFRKSLRVSGTADNEAPELKGLTLSNATLDTRNGSATFSATLQITDNMVGLMGDTNSWEEGGAIGFTSPSGVGYVWTEIYGANRISGTSANGTYQVWFQLPQYSEEGAWTIDYIELIDRNYNTRFLIPANLAAQQIADSTIQVQGWARGWEQQSFASATSTKGNATIQLSNLSLTYNGTEKVPTIATNPGNLTQNVTLTYNGTTTPPIDAGSYTVVAFMNHPAYQGRQVETMTISNPPPPPPPAPGGGAPSGGGGEPEKSKKGKKGSAKKDSSDKKSLNKKSDKKSSGGGDSKKSKGKKSGGKKKKK